jgi:hypothetical protein
MERRGTHIGFLWETQKEKDHWVDVDLNVSERLILRWILEGYNDAVCTGLIWLRMETNRELL